MVVIGVVLGACSPPKYRYVTNAAAKTYLKVPRSWKAYSGDRVRAAEAKVASETPGQPVPSEVDLRRRSATTWQMAFDSDPEPDVAHALVQSLPRYPVVDVTVRSLNNEERDGVSNATLRNLIYSYDQLKKTAEDEKKLRPLGAPEVLQTFEALAEGELQREGGVRGVQEIFRLRGSDGASYIVNQTFMVDSRNSRIYQLLIRAGEKVYLDNQPMLAEIVRSFTVKQKA